MKFYTDDQRLRVGVYLDSRDGQIDLTAGRPSLGDQILDEVVFGMIDSHTRCQSPEGQPWPELAPSTVRRKHHQAIGIDTGKTHFLDPRTWTATNVVLRTVKERECYVEFSRSDKRWGQCHGWQNGVSENHVPARRVMGWTSEAIKAVSELLKDAQFRAGE
jgi:hypothetical protein